MLKIGVLISGGGTNLQAIIDGCASKKIEAEVVVVLSNRLNAFGLQRSEKAGISNVGLSKKDFEDKGSYFRKITELLKGHEVDLVVLAGFLEILPETFVKSFEHKIINIHPSLIPKYAGKGFYGLKVHEAVIENKDLYTGATVHFVDGQVDTGQIIVQEALKVLKEDTPETLQKRVLTIEHQLMIKSIDKYIKGEI